MKGINPAVKKALCLCMAAAMTVSNLTIASTLSVNASSESQTSSLPETIYVNSYYGTERSQLFDSHWRFHRGDSSGAEAPTFNDSSWSDVQLPHDYSIEEAYSKSGEAESAYLPGGVGWYRKSFSLSPEWKDKVISVDFGGVYMNSTVYINGHKLGTHPYGYTPFSFVLPKEHLNFDKENVIAVRVDHQTPSSRWYSGSGIYRSVHLTVTDPVHIARYGTSVVTPTQDTGDVKITSKVQNDSQQPAEVFLKHSITEKGKTDVLATVSGQAASVAAGETKEFTENLHLNEFKKWDIGQGNLYTVTTEVVQNNTTVDTYTTDFGFRWYQFDKDNGFMLNGTYHKLQGVCMHHDQGPLGSEAWRRAIERQVEILQDMGVNAIRVTHNPAADELIDICNQKGMLIIDEAFDTWTSIKNYNTQDYSRWFNTKIEADNTIVGGKPGEMIWAKFDLTTMVNRDKNAPSVIMYSLGNELLEITSGNTSNYPKMASELSGWVKEIDPNRPITFGDNKLKVNNPISIGMAKSINEAGGVVGFNYASINQMNQYNNKNWKMYGSETASAVNSRGVYDRKGSQQDKGGDRLLTSYDKSKVGWGALASEAWWNTITVANNAGTFVWTGFDYLGEPTPWNNPGVGVSGGTWPAPKHSYFGIVDIAGFPKDSYYFYQSQWNEKKNTLHILPTWNKDEITLDRNNNVEVVVYSDAPFIKLFLNDQLVGTATAEQKTAGKYTYQQYTKGTDHFVPKKDHESLYATFNVPYAEGTLRAEAWTAENGTKIENTDGRSQVKTVGAESALSATADRTEILADGRDLSYITIDVQDANGNFVNSAEPQIEVSISGNGRILAMENGMHNDHTPYTSTSRKAMKGKLLVVAQSTDEAGEFTVTAHAPGLKPASVKVTTKATESDTQTDRVVSYQMSRNIYVLKGTTAQLPTEVTLNYASGKAEKQPVEWEQVDPSKYNENGTFVVHGKIPSVNISTQLNITVMDGVAALQNYSTAIMLGSTPSLPSTRPAIQADGTILSAEFPVTWNTENLTFNEEKVYEVSGSSNVFGQEMKVTAFVRVGQGEITEGDNLGPAAAGLYWNSKDDTHEKDLRPLVDGKKEGKTWKGTGSILFRYDTAQNLYKVAVTRKADSKQVTPKIYWSGNGEEWTEVSTKSAANGNTDIYTLDQLVPAVWVKLEFPEEVTLTETELIVGTSTFTLNKSADLSKIVLDGVEVDKASMKAHDYPTQVLAVYETQITSDANAAYTVLPEHEKVIRILTESEDKSAKSVYTIRLGQDSTGTVSPDDDSHDYTGKITATAPSNAKPSATEGGAELAIDKNANTIWHSNWGGGTGSMDLQNKPEERYIELQLEQEVLLNGLRYLPRHDAPNGRITQYEVKVSTNGTDWQTAATGTWDDNAQWKLARFTAPFKAKQVRLYGIATAGPVANKFMSAAEIAVQQFTEAAAPTDLSSAKITLDKSYNYTGYPVEPRPVVVLGEKTLRYGIDYRLEYANNVEAGTATLRVIGMIAYTGQIESTFTINPVDIKVERYEPVQITVQVGEDPSTKLPTVVKTHMNVGPVRELPVVWNPINPEQYAQVGLFTVEGTVEGETLKPTAVIQVIGALAAENVSMSMLAGTQPSLPTALPVYFSDGTTAEHPVEWKLDGLAFTAGETVVVPGTITVGSVTLQPTASVRVLDPAQLESKLLSQKVNGSTLPLAVSFYSPSADSAANINDGSMLFQNTDGKMIWSDWERDTFHTDPWVGIVLGEGDTAKAQSVNKISIGFIAETKETALKVPQDFTVQYYVGETLDYDAGNVNNGKNWPNMSNPENWKDVPNLQKGQLPTDEDFAHMIDATFDTVTTKAIRVVMTPKDKQWVGVEELQVYGIQPQSYADFQVSSIKLDGTERLADFNEQKTLVVNVSNNKLPTIEASATNNAAVTVIPSIDPNGKAFVVIVPENGDASKAVRYTIQFQSDAPIAHTVTVESSHLKASISEALPGETVVISLDNGYSLKENTLKVMAGETEISVDASTLSFKMPAAAVTVTAETQPIVYDIVYDLAGGQLSEQNPAAYTIETASFTLHNPVRDGYEFEGWITKENATPVKEVVIESGSTGARSFIAVWKATTPTEKPDSAPGENSAPQATAAPAPAAPAVSPAPVAKKPPVISTRPMATETPAPTEEPTATPSPAPTPSAASSDSAAEPTESPEAPANQSSEPSAVLPVIGLIAVAAIVGGVIWAKRRNNG